MPAPRKLHPVQESFAAGELTPRLAARHSEKIHAWGLEELLNMVPLRQGPVSRRRGTTFVEQYPGTAVGRLFTFDVSPSQNFVVVINDDGNLRVNDISGQVLENNIVVNPFFDDGLDDWTDISEAQAGVVWTNGTVAFGSQQVGRDAILAQELTIIGGQENNLHQVDLTSIPSSATARFKVRIGTAINTSDILEVTLIEGITSFTFNPGGNATVWLTLVFEGVAPLSEFWTIDSVRCSHIGAGGVIFAHPWDADDITELQAEMPPGEDVLWFTCPRKPQQELIYTKATDAWAFQPISFTDPPAVWAGSNFPAAVTFFQGRSWFGGTPDQPATFWASKSAIIRDFTIGSLADDAMEFVLSRRGRIEWMEGVKNLLIGTENSEFIVTSEGGIIEPGDIQVEQQSAYGSTNVGGLPVGKDVLYLSADGRKLRKISWSWTEEGWLSQELSWQAEHMGNESAMREVHYIKDPESIVVMLNAAGGIWACTYDTNNNFYGWQRTTTAGRIISLTVTQQRGTSILWLLVDRGINDPTTHYLETFTFDSSVRDYVDSHVVQLNDPASTDVTGVTHLADQTVSVVVDDATHPDITLDSNGDGTLQFPGSRIVVGQRFTSRMKTLPFDMTGQDLGKRKRYNRIFVRLLDSALPIVNGERQPDRAPATLMDTTEPDRTDDVETRNLGWDQFAQVTVEQDLARALIVTAIFGELTTGNT